MVISEKTIRAHLKILGPTKPFVDSDHIINFQIYYQCDISSNKDSVALAITQKGMKGLFDGVITKPTSVLDV